MRLTNIESESRVADLVARLYDLRDASEATKRQVREALFEANPHLERDLRRVPRGTVILVPDVPGITSVAETGPSPAARGLTDALRAALEQAGQELDASATAEIDEAKGALEVLKSRELRKAIARSPELQERMPVIANDAKGRVERAEAARAVQSETLAALQEDLEAFLGALPG